MNTEEHIDFFFKPENIALIVASLNPKSFPAQSGKASKR